MGDRESSILLTANAASGTSPEMLFPTSGAVLSITGLTSGNILLQSYETGTWTTLFTYTSNTSVQPNVSPGILVRISWNTVVGTPSISMTPASDNGFAEAAADIVTIEGDVASVEETARGVLIIDADGGNYTIASGDNPVSTIYVANGAANTNINIIVADATAALMGSIVNVYNNSLGTVTIYYSSNSGAAKVIASTMKMKFLNAVLLTEFLSFDSNIVSLDRSAVAVTVNSGGTNADLSGGGFLVPAKSMGTNGQIILKLDLSSSGIVGTRTIGVYFDGTLVNSYTMSSVQVSSETRICNRNSVSSQRCKLHSQYSCSVVTNVAALTKNTENDILVTVLCTNPSDSVTLESYSLELMP